MCFLFLSIESNVLGGREDQDVQRSQIGARRAVGVSSVLTQQPNAIQVKHLKQFSKKYSKICSSNTSSWKWNFYLHRVRKMVERILVDEWHQADHKRNRSVTTDHVGVSAVLQQHVQQLVAKLPVAYVAQDARQCRVTRLVDRWSRTLSAKMSLATGTTLRSGKFFTWWMR